MANNSTAGYGCRQTMTVGNTPATGGQSEFNVQGGGSPGATVAIFKGAPVQMQKAAGAGALGFIQDSTAATMTDGDTGGAMTSQSVDDGDEADGSDEATLSSRQCVSGGAVKQCMRRFCGSASSR